MNVTATGLNLLAAPRPQGGDLTTVPIGSAPSVESTTYRPLFSVPFISRNWGDSAGYNEIVRKAIFARQKISKGESHSNVGGWHSESGQLEFLGAAAQWLIDRAYELAGEAMGRVFSEYGLLAPRVNWKFEAWANVCRDGDFNSAHTHPGSTWSGVYYVDTGMPTSPIHSQLQLLPPCQGLSNGFLPLLLPDTICITPNAGQMILFPSYLGHMVVPHKGTKSRISIAFNLRKDPFP